MKHLIILARPENPRHETFAHAIASTIEQATIEAGSEVRIRDLYQLGFDPVLSSKDLGNLSERTYAADIVEEQKQIAWADVISFVYPVWWVGMPAILKGYVDRVLANGFAFSYDADGQHKLLKGKKGFLFSTTGLPFEYYADNGVHKAMQITSDAGIFEYCGIEVIKHVFLGSIPYISEDERKEHLNDIAELVKSNL